MSRAASTKNVPRKDAHESANPVPSREARRLASAILEVLAGLRSPTEAAQALSVSVPRYYTLEQRALDSLVASCEPRPRGRVQSPQQRVADLEREVQRLRQQCDRHLALARAAQRTVGWSPPAPSARNGKDQPKDQPNGKSGKKRSRRPVVRALKAVQALRDEQPVESSLTSEVAETVSAASSQHSKE